MHINIFIFGPEIRKNWVLSLCSHFDTRSYGKRDGHSITLVSEIARFVKRKQ